MNEEKGSQTYKVGLFAVKLYCLLWIFYVFRSCVCYVFVCVCLFVPCGHLLGKDLWCITVSLSLSIGILGYAHLNDKMPTIVANGRYISIFFSKFDLYNLYKELLFYFLILKTYNHATSRLAKR